MHGRGLLRHRNGREETIFYQDGNMVKNYEKNNKESKKN